MIVDQLGRRLGHHAAVRPRPRPRRRRAGGAGGDQRRRQPAARRPAGAADLRQGQSGRRADPDAGVTSKTLPLTEVRGPRRHAAGAEDLAAPRRRPGQRSAAASGRRCASRSIRARSPPTGSTSTTCAPTIANANVNTPKGSFDGPSRAYTINANDQISDRRASTASSSSPTATARRCGSRDVADGRERRREHAAGGLDEHGRRRHPQRPAPARRQRHRRSSTRIKQLLPQLQAACRRRCTVDAC